MGSNPTLGYFRKNNMSTYFIGDIHGELGKLEALLKVVEAKDSNPKYIFLGDYVDRGPCSRGVLALLQELEAKGHVCIAGNHDYMMADGYRGHMDQRYLWLINGGGDTEVSYWRSEDQIEKDIAWIRTLPRWYETDDFYASHAPVAKHYLQPEFAQVVHYKSRDSLCWFYDEPEGSVEFDMINKRGKIGVCGHIHALRRGICGPRFYPHYWFVDGGCGCSPKGNLIAACLEEKIWYNQTGHVEKIEETQPWMNSEHLGKTNPTDG